MAERNVTRAAARNGLSQPAVSKALNRLRWLFDDPLFVLRDRAMEPTARAHQLAGPIRGALADISRPLTLPDEFDPATIRATVKIVTTDLYHTRRGAGRFDDARPKPAPPQKTTSFPGSPAASAPVRPGSPVPFASAQSRATQILLAYGQFRSLAASPPSPSSPRAESSEKATSKVRKNESYAYDWFHGIDLLYRIWTALLRS
jgi:hypothetical protein